MKTVIVSFGLIILCLLILFRLPVLYPIGNAINNQTWIVVFSILFLLIGIILSRKLFTKTVIVTQLEPSTIEYSQLIKSGLSKRESDILLLVHDGLSNQQIADKLFLSENTIKKHLSNIFQKLNVDRRTEAIKKARELSIIA